MILVLVETPDDLKEKAGRILPDAELIFTDPDDAAYEGLLAGAEIIFGHPAIDTLTDAARLQWLHLPSAGADPYAHRMPPGVTLTNASGVYGIPAAEHAFSMMLALARRLPDAVRAAGQARWDRSGHYDELFGRTCGILGLGDIGASVARRAEAFGMRVLGLRRRPAKRQEIADRIFGPDGLHEMLADCDHVVNTLPSTTSTRHLIDTDALRSMKQGACFYNVGRGSTVDEAALVEALESGHLAGAGLDVFEDEPLPSSSPLWGMDNVIVTPHVGGLSPREAEREAELFLENLVRWANGRELLNVVDSELGY